MNDRNGHIAAELSVWAGYCLLSMAYFHRVVSNLTTHIAGHGGDGWQNLWNMWWFEQAVLRGTNPYFTDMLHHPHGHTLLFHTFNPFNAVLALPLKWLFGQPAAYNIVAILSFVTTAGFTYMLLRRIGAGRAGSFLAGCALSFGPFHFAHAQGHMQLVAMEGLPLSVYFGIGLAEKRRIRDGVAAGLALGLTAFCSFYYLAAAMVVIGLGAAAMAVRLRKELLEPALLKASAAAMAAFACTGGILVASMLASYGSAGLAPAHDPAYWSADVQSFFVPSWILAAGRWFTGISGRWTGNTAECNQYLGYSLLVLAFLGFILRRDSRPWGWLGLMVLGIVLELGPYLHVGGRVYRSIPLPFGWIERLFPPLALSGAPVRWHVLCVLGLSVCAGLGLDALWRRVSDKKGSHHAAAAAVAACALVLLELLPRPVDATEIPRWKMLGSLASEPAGEAVYDTGDPNLALLRQTQHRHPLVGGYLARVRQSALDFERHDPLLRALRGEQVLTAEQVKRMAASLGLRHVLARDSRANSLRMSRLGLSLRAKEKGVQWWVIGW